MSANFQLATMLVDTGGTLPKLTQGSRRRLSWQKHQPLVFRTLAQATHIVVRIRVRLVIVRFNFRAHTSWRIPSTIPLPGWFEPRHPPAILVVRAFFFPNTGHARAFRSQTSVHKTLTPHHLELSAAHGVRIWDGRRLKHGQGARIVSFLTHPGDDVMCVRRV
jgi:hypothetical protein